jgi:hypothetical protein
MLYMLLTVVSNVINVTKYRNVKDVTRQRDAINLRNAANVTVLEGKCVDFIYASSSLCTSHIPSW